MQNVHVQVSSSNSSTPSRTSEDNASWPDEKKRKQKGRGIALEKGIHAQPTSGSAPKRPLPFPATPIPANLKQDEPSSNRSFSVRAVALVWKAFVLYVALFLIYRFVVDFIAPAMSKTTWRGVKVA